MKEEAAMSINEVEMEIEKSVFDRRASAIKVAREVLSSRGLASNTPGMTSDLIRVADWLLTGEDSWTKGAEPFDEFAGFPVTLEELVERGYLKKNDDEVVPGWLKEAFK